MTAPSVNQLPTSPARLSRPSSFVTDSTVFLDSLSSFRTNVNQLSSYINALIQNKYNYGTLFGIRDFPSIFQTLLHDIEFDGDSVIFTSDLDTLYLTLHNYSSNLNSFGEWYDRVIEEVGIVPYDLDKPLISGIAIPMHRTQSREDFNNTAEIFTETCINNINSLFQSAYYTYITSCGNKNFGSIVDTTIIKTIDGGSILDTNLTY